MYQNYIALYTMVVPAVGVGIVGRRQGVESHGGKHIEVLLPVGLQGQPVECLWVLVDGGRLLLGEELVVQVQDALAVAKLTAQPVASLIAALPDLSQVGR